MQSRKAICIQGERRCKIALPLSSNASDSAGRGERAAGGARRRGAGEAGPSSSPADPGDCEPPSPSLPPLRRIPGAGKRGGQSCCLSPSSSSSSPLRPNQRRSRPEPLAHGAVRVPDLHRRSGAPVRRPPPRTHRPHPQGPTRHHSHPLQRRALPRPRLRHRLRAPPRRRPHRLHLDPVRLHPPRAGELRAAAALGGPAPELEPNPLGPAQACSAAGEGDGGPE